MWTLAEIQRAICSVASARPLWSVITGRMRIPPVITVIPLTARTYKRPHFPTHVLIPKTSGTGLARNSMALAEQVSTIDKTCLMEKKGAVTDLGIMAAVTKALQIQIGAVEKYN